MIDSEYQAWTWKAVRERIVEAYRVSRLLPKVRGPKHDQSFWPSFRQEHSGSSFRRRAMPDEISRMEEVMTWIAGVAEEAHRKLLHDYAKLKTVPGARIGVWCEENGWAERILNRRIHVICQGIADDLNRKSALRLDADGCGLSEMPSEHHSRALPSEIVLEGAGPAVKSRDIPDHPDRKATVRRINRWAAARSRKAEATRTDRP